MRNLTTIACKHQNTFKACGSLLACICDMNRWDLPIINNIRKIIRGVSPCRIFLCLLASWPHSTIVFNSVSLTRQFLLGIEPSWTKKLPPMVPQATQEPDRASHRAQKARPCPRKLVLSECVAMVFRGRQ